MKKIILSTILIGITAIAAVAQVGIGTTTPNASSILDLTSTNKAFLPPRMTSAQRDAIANPVDGMVIFNTTTTCIEFFRGSGWLNLCTGNTTILLPPIDGYDSSNQVAASNLIGYWPFDGTTTEKTHGVAPVLTGGTSTYVTGKLGQGISFTNGWLTYPTTATGAGTATNMFNSSDTLAKGFTVSLWAQVPDTSLLTDFFQLSIPAVTNWEELGLAYRKASNTAVDLDGGLTNVDGTGTHPSYADAYLQPAFKDSLSWAFVAMTYDTTGGGKLIYYANGAKVGTVSLTTLTNKPFPAPPEALLMVTPNYATIGTFESSTTTPGGSGTIPSFMSTGITGVLDDIRLYNATLTTQQINDLFQLGNQGR